MIMEISTKKVIFVVVLCLISFVILDFGIGAIALYCSTKPKRIYHAVYPGQRVEVFYSTQGAFGADVISVYFERKKFGSRTVSYSISNITKLDYYPDSVIVTYSQEGVIDTCVIHREIRVPHYR